MIFDKIERECHAYPLGDKTNASEKLILAEMINNSIPDSLDSLYTEIDYRSMGVASPVSFAYMQTESNPPGRGSFDILLAPGGHNTWSALAQMRWLGGRIGKLSIPLCASPGGDLVVLVVGGRLNGLCYWKHDEIGPEGEIGLGNLHLICRTIDDFERKCTYPIIMDDE